MSNIKKEFATFEKNLKIYMSFIKVRNITRNYLSETEGNKYNNYTIEQFLLLYKLNRMTEMKVINESVSNKLKELLDIKMQVDNLIGEETRKGLYIESYKSSTLPELHKMEDIINKELKKYHLTIEDINFQEMIDLSIKTENNITKTENNNVRIKTKD